MQTVQVFRGEPWNWRLGVSIHAPARGATLYYGGRPLPMAEDITIPKISQAPDANSSANPLEGLRARVAEALYLLSPDYRYSSENEGIIPFSELDACCRDRDLKKADAAISATLAGLIVMDLPEAAIAAAAKAATDVVGRRIVTVCFRAILHSIVNSDDANAR